MSIESIDMRSAALLVIDLQNAFIHEHGTLGISGVDTKRLSSIVPKLQTLIPQCQQAGIPVIWTVQEHLNVDHSRASKKLASHTARRKRVSCIAGTWDAEIVDELKPFAAVNPTFCVRKHRYGAFFDTRLDMLLRMLGVRTLLIAGTTINACVETSIREAYLRDFDVLAVKDCISGVRDSWETMAFEVWDQYFCQFTSSNDIQKWIDRETAPHPLGYGHMLMMVSDMKKSLAFYEDLVGFRVRPAKPLADGRPFVAFTQGIALIEGRQTGHRQIDHMAFEVNRVSDLRDRLKAAGVEFQDDLHDGPYGLTIYVTDPDGLRLEFYQVGADLGSH